MTESAHEKRWENMIAWRCKCGAGWSNEKLKGKSDEEITAERDSAFADHVISMEAQGY